MTVSGSDRRRRPFLHVNKLAELARYFIFNAPWTLVSTFAAGISTYVIMIMLARFEGLEAVGQFRLLLSVIAMLSLATLRDTGKILLKYFVQNESGIVRPLLVNRVRWSLIGVAGGLVTAYVFHLNGNPLAYAIGAVSLLVPLIFPFNLYSQIHQSRRQFRFNALINLAKFSTLVVVAAIWFAMGWNLIAYFVAYHVILAVFHVWYLSWHKEIHEPAAPGTERYVKEATYLSGSGLLQVVLEHADKFLISYFLGLEALGLYAIGVSTGRLLLNFIKPILVIYLPDFVGKRLTLKFQALSFVALTLFGCVAAAVMWFAMNTFMSGQEMASFPIAAVVVVGIGIYFVGVTKYYSAIYYKSASLKIPILTNLITTPLIVLYLVGVLQFGGSYALVLCAASYPLRELINVIVIGALTALLKGHHDGKAAAVPAE